jgi:lipopolysaccharide transport system permease protein
VAAPSAAADSGRLPVTYIRPGTWGLRVALREVWLARELLYFLVWRDIKVRYKQTVLGIAWAVVQPLLTMVVFTALFGKLGRIPSDGLPYPLFSFAGLVPWTYFAAALAAGAGSLGASRYLIAKVYFPRVLVPLAAVLTPAVDMIVSLGMLAVLMAFYGVVPGPALLLLPLLFVFLVLLAFSITLWTSALSVHYRDMRYLIPFATQLLLFLTPVAYPASLVPERLRLLYGLNPMATVVEGFRSAILGTPLPGTMAFVSVAVVLVALVTGLSYFRSVESSMVDLI